MQPKSTRLKIQRALLLTLPFLLFFSYYPIIPLGATESMNLELSLPLLWLALYATLSLPEMLYFLQHLGAKKSLLLLSFPLYLALSLLWSENPLRTVLAAGTIVCLIISVCTFPQVLKNSPGLKQKLATSLLLSALLVSVFCWLQCLLDVLGTPRGVTLLCEGCTYQSFGFPHPNGFAIEPQFMGSLLLAPVALSFYRLFTAGRHSSKLRYTLITFFLTTTLFLVFSRGAIYSFLAAAAVAIVALIIKKSSSSLVKPLLALPLILVSFLTALCAQGILAELAPTSDNFSTAIAKSIHQLSLGKIDLRQTKPEATPPEPTESTAGPTSDTTPVNPPAEPPETTAAQPHFSGYVAESTDYRLSLNQIAWQTYTRDTKTILTGVGLGAAGPAMYQVESSLGSPKEIVQNEYVSLLLEVGLFGLFFLILTLIQIFTSITKHQPQVQTPTAQASRQGKSEAFVLLRAQGCLEETKTRTKSRTQLIFLASLALAFLLSLNFFSGLPNALHLYLLVPLALILAKHQPVIH